MTKKQMRLIRRNLINEIKQQGFVGLDFRMAAVAIIENKIKFAAPFVAEKHNSYWANKRHFGEIHLADEQEILNMAKKYERVNL